jgi:hypothetical protein
VRKARNRVSIGWKYFEIVELFEVAIANITTGFVAFPDQGSVAGRGDFVRGMTEGASHDHASVPVTRTPREVRYIVAS